MAFFITFYSYYAILCKYEGRNMKAVACWSVTVVLLVFLVSSSSATDFGYCSVDYAQCQFGCDFYDQGFDVGAVKATSHGECAKQCWNHQSCNHFTWNAKENGGTCFMKAAFSPQWKFVDDVTCGYLDSQKAFPRGKSPAFPKKAQ